VDEHPMEIYVAVDLFCIVIAQAWDFHQLNYKNVVFQKLQNSQQKTNLAITFIGLEIIISYFQSEDDS
jgi:hypothetical protein